MGSGTSAFLGHEPQQEKLNWLRTTSKKLFYTIWNISQVYESVYLSQEGDSSLM